MLKTAPIVPYVLLSEMIIEEAELRENPEPNVKGASEDRGRQQPAPGDPACQAPDSHPDLNCDFTRVNS
jgi:hypothetical protein